MKSSPTSDNLLQCHKNKNETMKLQKLWFLLMWILCLTPASLLLTLIVSNWSAVSSKQIFNQSFLTTKPKIDYNMCDLFTGHWIREIRESGYSNWSCSTIFYQNNCFKYGRDDADFVNWRWKPRQCELPRFNPKAFWKIVRGKTLALIGDSIAKNHVESLMCLLSQEETPVNVHQDAEDRSGSWYYSSHDFTLKVLWSPWLVSGGERVVNSTEFHLEIDKVDEMWSKQLSDMDYVIISGSHWFVRKLYLYKQGTLIGCMNCDDTNVTHVDIRFALRMAFRTTLKYINDCEKCKGLVTWVRTSSPSHFEQGSWDGGKCNRTSLLSLKEAMDLNLGGISLEFRKTQVEEVERAKNEGRQNGVRIEVFDITDAMLTRPDGHPDIHWDNRYMPGYSDCIHWCLPGPIDAWNDMLLALLKEDSLSPWQNI